MIKTIRKVLFPTEGRYAKFMDFVRPVGGALLIAFTFRTFLYDPYRIPSTSMLPTLLVGDYLFVSRFAYGTKVPFTDVVLNEKQPLQGDIVVFRKELNPGQGKTNYIKRIVALPGDQVAFRDKTLYVNGKPQMAVRDTVEPNYSYQESGYDLRATRFFETLTSGVVHDVLKDPLKPALDLGTVTVPADSYVVLGDNRDHSYDTRFWKYPYWSFVQKEEIIGRAEFLYWSWNDRFVPRWSRLFDSLRVKAKAE